MEPIICYLQRKLREAGSRRYESIAVETGVSPWLLPKIANGNRDNPRVQTVQPLIDYFRAIDSGEKRLPEPDIDPRYLPSPRPTLHLPKKVAA